MNRIRLEELSRDFSLIGQGIALGVEFFGCIAVERLRQHAVDLGADLTGLCLGSPDFEEFLLLSLRKSIGSIGTESHCNVGEKSHIFT